MLALDQCHEQVVRALQKEGWIIEQNPARISFDQRTIYIDLQARYAANGTNRQITLIEVKCFPDGSSNTQEIYIASGQYIARWCMNSSARASPVSRLSCCTQAKRCLPNRK